MPAAPPPSMHACTLTSSSTLMMSSPFMLPSSPMLVSTRVRSQLSRAMSSSSRSRLAPGACAQRMHGGAPCRPACKHVLVLAAVLAPLDSWTHSNDWLTVSNDGRTPLVSLLPVGQFSTSWQHAAWRRCLGRGGGLPLRTWRACRARPQSCQAPTTRGGWRGCR